MFLFSLVVIHPAIFLPAILYKKIQYFLQVWGEDLLPETVLGRTLNYINALFFFYFWISKFIFIVTSFLGVEKITKVKITVIVAQ